MRLADRSRKVVAGFGAVAALALAVVVSHSYAQQAPPARGQQPPARGARGNRGGGPINIPGFTHADPINFNDHTGWTQLFDGTSLKGWEGDSNVWHVADGAIVGESSPEKPSGTTNIFYTAAQPANFMLKLEIKLEGQGANGGIQYRSKNVPPKPFTMPADRMSQMTDQQKKQMDQMQAMMKKNAKWNMEGYQADIDFASMWSGQLYEQGTDRHIISWPGDVVETQDGKKTLIASLGTPAQMKSYVKAGQWNQYEIIAQGNVLTHIINGHIMTVTVDNDTKNAASKGLIGFEIEGDGVVKISHRDIWLKNLP